VKAYLRAQRAAFPQSRILFVRRTERRSQDGIVAFVARTTEAERWLRCVELERHDDLVGLDLLAAGEPVDHPLFLVCTHGKHDRCCSKYGRPLYAALSEQVDEGWAWQSSHVGGDRFAGNVVVLPDGAYYGRVEPASSWAVLEAALRGDVHLPLYRGRSCHTFPEQAAERAVREQTGLLGVADTSVRSIVRTPVGWTIVIGAGGAEYEVDVRREEGEPTHLTCSTEQLRRPRHYGAGSPRARAS
jgi:(2Fe-2S) ferredoxin